MYLMDRDSQHGAGRHLSHPTSRQFSLSLLSNVDVAIELGSATGIHDVLRNLRVADDSGILLAWRDGGTVTSNIGIDCRLLARSHQFCYRLTYPRSPDLCQSHQPLPEWLRGSVQ